MVCKSCNAESGDNQKFCGSCGSALAENEAKSESVNINTTPVNTSGKCSKCGAQLNNDWQYCFFCGQPIRHFVQSRPVQSNEEAKSLASLILGIIGTITGAACFDLGNLFFHLVAFALGIPAIVLGSIDIRQKKSFAIAGIILGSIAVMFSLTSLIIGIAFGRFFNYY